MDSSPAIDAAQLKRRFIDPHRSDTDARTLNAVARMVLEMESDDGVMAAGLEHLAETFRSDRVDAGFGSARQAIYRPSAEHRCSGAITMVNRDLPNRQASLQTVWRQGAPLAVHNVQRHPLVASMRDDLKSLGTEAMLIQRLSVSGQGIGIVCVDDLANARRWTRLEQRSIQVFCDRFFAPLLQLSRHTQAPHDAPITAAELAAVRCAAKGMRYKQIAAQLGKSVRTVEHQLRSARAKTGAANQVDLVRRCKRWL